MNVDIMPGKKIIGNLKPFCIAADIAQFEEQRDFPYKQVQYQQSLLQGLPVEAMSRDYIEPSQLSEILGYGGTLAAILEKLGIVNT